MFVFKQVFHIPPMSMHNVAHVKIQPLSVNDLMLQTRQQMIVIYV